MHHSPSNVVFSKAPEATPAPNAADISITPKSRVATQRRVQLAPVVSPEIQVAPPKIQVQRRQRAVGQPEVRVKKPIFAPAPKPTPINGRQNQAASNNLQSVYITDQPETQQVRTNVVRVAGESQLTEISTDTTSDHQFSHSVFIPLQTVPLPSEVEVTKSESGLMGLRATNVEMVACCESSPTTTL